MATSLPGWEGANDVNGAISNKIYNPITTQCKIMMRALGNLLLNRCSVCHILQNGKSLTSIGFKMESHYFNVWKVDK